ncbi:MAG TPA: PrsW family intramembrane metalloprotease [Longimicrobiaceae bacterium]|nr:PrsW family intramembrane metalloprotease [Longimicrobiaceae bacterium]
MPGDEDVTTDPAPGEQPAGGEPAAAEAAALPPPNRHPILTRGAVVCGVLTLLVILLEVGPDAFVAGALIAVIPVPLYVVLALWLDRFEPEPGRVLAQTFAWGATVAVLIALVINGVGESMLMETLGPDAADVLGAIAMAPVVEETAKGLALLALFRELKDEFDGVVDGVVYAAMVGLGFAMMENVQYYGAAVAEGAESSVLTFVVRGMMSPFAHPLFTSLFGIGLGFAREGHHRPGIGRRVFLPAAGFAAAVGLHSLWNRAALMEGDWFLVLYISVMVPTFCGVLLLIAWSLRREGRVVRQHLAHLVDEGLLLPDELDTLCGVRRRMLASFVAWRRGGVTRWRDRRELHRTASELAFHRWRVVRGLSLGEAADARREAEYLGKLRDLCRRYR